jgi:hypothetical protein
MWGVVQFEQMDGSSYRTTDTAFRLTEALVCLATLDGLPYGEFLRLCQRKRRGHAWDSDSCGSSTATPTDTDDDLSDASTTDGSEFELSLMQALLHDLHGGLRHVGIGPSGIRITANPPPHVVHALVHPRARDYCGTENAPQRSLWRQTHEARALEHRLAADVCVVFLLHAPAMYTARQHDVVLTAVQALLHSPRALRSTAEFLNLQLSNRRTFRTLPHLLLHGHALMHGADVSIATSEALVALWWRDALRLRHETARQPFLPVRSDVVALPSSSYTPRTPRALNKRPVRRPSLERVEVIDADTENDAPRFLHGVQSRSDVVVSGNPLPASHSNGARPALGDGAAPVPVKVAIEYEWPSLRGGTYLTAPRFGVVTQVWRDATTPLYASP